MIEIPTLRKNNYEGMNRFTNRISLAEENYIQVSKRGEIRDRVRECPGQVIVSKISA